MTRPRSRALDRLLVTTFVSAWLLLFVPSLYTGLTSGVWRYPLGSFWAESISEYPYFYTPAPVYQSRPSPFHPGDRWIRVEGLDLRGVTYFDIVAAMRDKTARRAAIRHDIERDGRRIEVVVLPNPNPLSWWAIPAEVGAVLAASFLLLRAPRWRLARRFFITMLLWCLFIEAAKAGPALQVFAQVGLNPAAMALLLWMASELTEAARPVRSWQRVAPWVVAGVQALLWAGMFFLPISLATPIDWSQLPRMNQAA